MVASTAVNRMGIPQDVASLVSYLASDGSSFVTGTWACVFFYRDNPPVNVAPLFLHHL